MAHSKAVTASAFARNFGKYRVEAQRGPIPISNHGEVTGYFVAKADFEALVQHVRRAATEPLDQQSLGIGDLSQDILKAIGENRVDASYDHLDELLDRD